jgi:hypothetical protein
MRGKLATRLHKGRASRCAKGGKSPCARSPRDPPRQRHDVGVCPFEERTLRVHQRPPLVERVATPVGQLRHVTDPVRQGGFGDLAWKARLIARPVAERGAEAMPP